MIDLLTLKASVDLLALVGRDTDLRRKAGSGGGEWAGPCPFCGGRDRFCVQPLAPGGGRWLCRHCTDGKWADVLTYVMRRESCDFRRACELLGAVDSLPVRHRPRVPVESEPDGPPPAGWQAGARTVIDACERALWSGERGEGARNWLAARGLQAETLRRWRIGYNPKGQRIGGLWVPHGILIPSISGGNIWYLKVRRLIGQRRYMQVTGSRPDLYLSETLAGPDTAVIVEGEFDALLLWQECRDLAGVATLGSASKTLDLGAWGACLLAVARLLIAYVADQAGRDGAQRWAESTQRARFVSVPTGKDITDFWQQGGNLRAWLTFELARQEAHDKPMSLCTQVQTPASKPQASTLPAGPIPLIDLPQFCRAHGVRLVGLAEWPEGERPVFRFEPNGAQV